MLAHTSNDRWTWPAVLAFLSHLEVFAVQQSCRSWHAQLASLSDGAGGPRNLVLNGAQRCAALLAAAADRPAMRDSVRAISFEFANQLQNFDLVPLGRFPHLTALNLNACRNLTDSAIEVVAEQCHKLQRLELYWDVVLTDISINALAAASFPPLLTHLNLSGLKHITDAAFVPLIKRCTQLTYLDLTRCEGLRDESLRAVGASCPHLQTLLLYATPSVTDAGFEAMAPGLPQLTHLDVTGTKLIGDRTVAAIARHCPRLRVLHLMWCTALTDVSLRAMGDAPLRRLELLSIHGLVHMTAAGIEALAKGCTALQAIDVNGCKNIGPYRMNKAELQRIFPSLQRLIFL